MSTADWLSPPFSPSPSVAPSPGGGEPTPTGVERAAEVVGNDHRFVTDGMWIAERYHRADAAHVQDSFLGDVYAIVGVRDLVSVNGYGEGFWGLYFPDYDYLFLDEYGWGYQTLRVADGCNDDGVYRSYIAAHAIGFPDQWVFVSRVDAAGNLDEIFAVANARFPAIVRGRRADGTDRVILLYEQTSDGYSRLVYHFIECDGTVGLPHPIRTAPSGAYIWHIEAAFNPYADQWRVFWDEYGPLSVPLRSRSVSWSGVFGITTTVVSNCDPHPVAPGMESEPGGLPIEVAATAPPDGEDDGSRAEGDGCKRFFAAFDPSPWNGSRRFALGTYGNRIRLVAESGAASTVAYWEPLDTIPNVGVCGVAECSYQSTGHDGIYGAFYLTNRRFGDDLGSCDGPPEKVSPTFAWNNHPFGLAFATGTDTAIALYVERSTPVGGTTPLYLTVLDE